HCQCQLEHHSQADINSCMKSLRRLNCVFKFAGCESTFGLTNNDLWKRHVLAQHRLLDFWRCTEGNCANNNQPTDTAMFTHKDHFARHLGRTHAPNRLKPLLRSYPGEMESINYTAEFDPELANWIAYACGLQKAAMHSGCALPSQMLCPVLECNNVAFDGTELWEEYMQHVAEHLKGGMVMFGGKGFEMLVQWASHPDVAIIERAEGGQWVLKNPPKTDIVTFVHWNVRQLEPRGRAGGDGGF
ncbi:hypothetical protein C8A05DRAFT_18028, partial [Staphylotrichum tortipilum]